MKAILSKKQAEILLNGGSLTYGRRSISIPVKGEIPTVLKRWVNDRALQEKYSIIVDTNDLSIDFMRRDTK